MNQIKKFVQEVQDENIPVSALLRKAKVIAIKLSQDNFLKWINSELDGYKDDDNYPDYRDISGIIKARNPHGVLTPIFFERPDVEKTMSRRLNKQSVTEIEHLLTNNFASYEMPYPNSSVEKILDDPLPGTTVSLIIDQAALVGLLNSIRNHLLDWALNLDHEGIKGDDEEFTNEEKQIAKDVGSTFNFENIENFSGNVGKITTPKKESLFSKFFWYVVVALIVIIVGNILSFLVLKYFFEA